MAKIGIIISLIVCLFITYQIISDKTAFKVERVIKIHDGDTFMILHKGKMQSVRFFDIDTPELSDPQCSHEYELALKAKTFVEKQVRKAKQISLVEIDKTSDPYGRWLARVYLDGRSIADMTIKAGLGRPYSGAKRTGWCKKPSS